MSVVQTGSLIQLTASSTTNTGTASTTITVPSDAEMVVVGVNCYSSAANAVFSGGSLTFTKGGTDTAMTSVQPTTTPDTTNNWSGGLFWMTLPDTGANKTLKWDWAGAANTDRHASFNIIFLKGMDTSSPQRAIGGGNSGGTPPYTADAMSVVTGDFLLAYTAAFTGDANGTNDAATWGSGGGITTLATTPVFDNGGGAFGSATASSTGSVTLSVASGTNYQDGVIYAIAIKPASGGGGSAPYDPWHQLGPLVAQKRSIVGWSPNFDARRRVRKPMRLIAPRRALTMPARKLLRA